jgi:hypothetical protein
MHKFACFAVALSAVVGALPASAETIIQSGPLAVQTFTQCNVEATYTLNTRRQSLSAGGWQVAPVGASGDGAQWQRSYNNGVFIAQRHLRSMPYTYLVPGDGTGLGCR